MNRNKASVSIANGQSLSAPIMLGAKSPLAIQMPAAWTAAVLTFQASADRGATYANMYDDAGTELQATADASRFIVLDPSKFAGVEYVKVRSGSAAAPVAQGAARELILITGQVV